LDAFTVIPDSQSIPEETRTRLAELERRVRELEERERAERELRRAAESASAAKTFFVASVSHEVRTPLTAILGYADLLRDDGLSPKERAAHLETIRRNGDHLLAVVSDILDLARIDAGQFAIVPADVVVADVVRDVVRLLALRAAAQGISLDHVVADPAARTPVRTDPVRVRQVLLNVVGNAVKFTEQGGVRVSVRAHEDAGEVRFSIEVRDTGPGIAPEDLERIFEPFQQSDADHAQRRGGSGLGLSISRHLAGLLGGSLSVRSQPGRGSTFTFEFASARCACGAALPEAASPAIPTSRRPPQGPLSGMHVMLVEDSIDSQRLISTLLALEGAEVTVSADGLDAVARFDGTFAPDLVLMDVQLPGMDGIEAMSRIRARGYRGRIAALTAAALGAEHERAAAAGCERIALKPIARADLVALCRGGAAAHA
jgi:signal transduction histidine kinase